MYTLDAKYNIWWYHFYTNIFTPMYYDITIQNKNKAHYFLHDIHGRQISS